MRVLSIVSLLLLLSLATLGAEVYSLDPALSPVYPFLILATIYSTFFFLALLGWLGAQFVFIAMKRTSSDAGEEGEEKNIEQAFLLQLSLRQILTCLIVAFAPVALIAVSSLHAIQLFDIVAIGVFELLALVYVFKKYR